MTYHLLENELERVFNLVKSLPQDRAIIARSGLPYCPDQSEWAEIFTMLCNCCAKLPGCEIIDGMIETKDGGPWPEGGWVTDAGAGVSCLSYEPKPMRTLPRPELERAMREAVPMCSGCAAQKGSEASVSLHTRRDFRAAVNAKALFTCHADGQQGKPCGGWCNAVK